MDTLPDELLGAIGRLLSLRERFRSFARVSHHLHRIMSTIPFVLDLEPGGPIGPEFTNMISLKSSDPVFKGVSSVDAWKSEKVKNILENSPFLLSLPLSSVTGLHVISVSISLSVIEVFAGMFKNIRKLVFDDVFERYETETEEPSDDSGPSSTELLQYKEKSFAVLFPNLNYLKMFTLFFRYFEVPKTIETAVFHSLDFETQLPGFSNTGEPIDLFRVYLAELPTTWDRIKNLSLRVVPKSLSFKYLAKLEVELTSTEDSLALSKMDCPKLRKLVLDFEDRDIPFPDLSCVSLSLQTMIIYRMNSSSRIPLDVKLAGLKLKRLDADFLWKTDFYSEISTQSYLTSLTLNFRSNPHFDYPVDHTKLELLSSLQNLDSLRLDEFPPADVTRLASVLPSISNFVFAPSFPSKKSNSILKMLLDELSPKKVISLNLWLVGEASLSNSIAKFVNLETLDLLLAEAMVQPASDILGFLEFLPSLSDLLLTLSRRIPDGQRFKLSDIIPLIKGIHQLKKLRLIRVLRKEETVSPRLFLLALEAKNLEVSISD